MYATQCLTAKRIRRDFVPILIMAVLIFSGLSWAEAPDSTAPRQVLLTWQGDTSTTMTITWRTDTLEGPATLRYTENVEAAQEFTTRTARTFTFAQTSALLHRVELTGLEPGTVYQVVIEHPKSPELFTFQTIPTGKEEIIFLAGGDSRSRRDVRRAVNELAAAQEPLFVVFTGDFINRPLAEQEWDDWFDDWHEQMITENGRRIPVVPAIGNHEVDGSYERAMKDAPFYYNRFATPEPNRYYALAFGPDLLLVTLDSQHTTLIPEQNEWLEQTLAECERPWKLVHYHVAAWPSVRDFNGKQPTLIREHWVPLFEQYGVRAVLEAHDHAYKQTVPIYGGQTDDERGVIYLGDGGWGAPVRDTRDPDELWWLKEAGSLDHFWRLTLSAEGQSLTATPVFLDPPEWATTVEMSRRKVLKQDE